MSNENQEKNPNAVALGKLGASKGGITRYRVLSPERRKEIAQLAAKARWAKREEELMREYLEDQKPLMKECGEEWF